METLEVKGKTLYYEMGFSSGEYSDSIYTIFYFELKTKLVNKYWLFGPLVEVPDNEVAFTIPFWIKDPVVTKSELKRMLEEKVELFFRKEEIERGELI